VTDCFKNSGSNLVNDPSTCCILLQPCEMSTALWLRVLGRSNTFPDSKEIRK
jgi:hypothetical protein